MDRTAYFYSRPSYYVGGGSFPVFSGSRRQRGGGIFGSLAKLVMPALKSVGKHALGQAASLAKDVAGDVIAGKNIKSSLMNRGKSRLMNIASNAGKQGINTLRSVTQSSNSVTPSNSIRQNRKRRGTKRLVSKQNTKRRRINQSGRGVALF